MVIFVISNCQSDGHGYICRKISITWLRCTYNLSTKYIECILPKKPYPPCIRMRPLGRIPSIYRIHYIWLLQLSWLEVSAAASMPWPWWLVQLSCLRSHPTNMSLIALPKTRFVFWNITGNHAHTWRFKQRVTISYLVGCKCRYQYISNEEINTNIR